MTTVATVAFCVGGLLVAGSFIFLLLMLSDLRGLWILWRRRPVPAGTRGRVAFEAVTEYGAYGPQVGPVSGEGCAWFRMSLIRSPSRRATGESGADFDIVLEVESPGWPVLADRAGQVAVDPRLVVPSALFDPIQTEDRITQTTTLADPVPPVVPEAVMRDLRRGDRLQVTEVRVPRGVAVFATGRVTSRGLRPSRLGLTVLTPGSRESVRAARRESIRTARTAATFMLLTGLLLAVPSVAWLSSLPG